MASKYWTLPTGYPGLANEPFLTDDERLDTLEQEQRDAESRYASKIDPAGVDFAGPLSVLGVPVGSGSGGATTSSEITDATAAGRALLTAANAAEQRTDLGVLPSQQVTQSAYDAGPKTDGVLYVIVG